MVLKLDKNISFIGKCVLIEDDFLEGKKKVKKKILALGDVHLGYGGVSGLLGVFRETCNDLVHVLQQTGKVDFVVVLGDVKHEFSGILDEEWRETRKFFEILRTYSSTIVVVKGNHDGFLEPISRELGFEMVDYYVLGKYGFLHGHKMYGDLLDKKIAVIMCGHLHPAVTLREGVKSERYKCFLVGRWNGKKIIVLPSFFPLVEGGDVFYHEGNLGFDLDVKKCEVYIVGENKVFYFGKMRKLKS